MVVAWFCPCKEAEGHFSRSLFCDSAPHSCCVSVLIACCGKGYGVVPWSRKQSPKQAPWPEPTLWGVQCSLHSGGTNSGPEARLGAQVLQASIGSWQRELSLHGFVLVWTHLKTGWERKVGRELVVSRRNFTDLNDSRCDGPCLRPQLFGFKMCTHACLINKSLLWVIPRNFLS